jgi:integrase
VAKITKRAVEALQPGERIADSEVRGFLVRRLDSGAASYAYRFRVKGTNRQRLISLGIHGSITAEKARALAKQEAGKVASGRDPKGEREATRTEAKRVQLAEANTVNALLDLFVKEYVNGADPLRSGGQIERAFDKYVRPKIGGKSIYSLQRADIKGLLDGIAKHHGPVMADRTLAHLRKSFNWWMKEHDDGFVSPIVSGMGKTKANERRRRRILTDDELRDVWTALDQIPDAPACYPAYVRNLLLTMTRRNDSSEMHTSELDGDVWIIPASRYKNKLDHAIPLSAMALENIRSAPAPTITKGQNSHFVFSTATTNRPIGKTPFSGFSKAKKELDQITTELRKAAGKPPMPQWQLHDLRRTGRTLMSRAGIPTDHAERAMGHVMEGVRATYDWHDFIEEKRRAFEALASTLKMILNPPANNVRQIARAGK